MNKVIAWTITAAIALGFAPSVFAITIEQLNLVDVTGDFVVGPGKIEAVMNPGETKVFDISVTNRMGEDRRFNVTQEDFVGSKDPSQTVILLGNDKSAHSLKESLIPEQQSFILKHGERARLPIRVSLPNNIEPGGHYASVLIDTVTVDKGGTRTGASGSAALVSRIGTLVFIRVPGPTSESGTLKDFSTVGDRKIFGSNEMIPFTLLYENTGSVHVNPYGFVHIKNLTGGEVATIKIDPWFSMPDSVRTREVQWNPPFLFGRYVATAEINRGYGDNIDTLSYSFWVIPWKLMLVALAAIVLLIILVKFVFSKFEFRRKE